MFGIKRNFYSGILVMVVSLLLFCGQSIKNPEFENAEQKWRADRDKSMRSETSWLTISGLFWLVDGENSFGAGDKNKIKLPVGSCDNFVGKFILEENKILVI